MKAFLFLALTLFSALPLHAHQVGNDAWCLAYTTYHRECIFSKEGPCEDSRKSTEKYFKNNQKAFERILTESTAGAKGSFKDFQIHCEQNFESPATQKNASL